MQIIDLFQTYAWVVMGELITNGITLFNITFASKSSARTVALKVSHLVMVELSGVAISFADARAFQQNDTTSPATTTTCGYHLTLHSMLMT